MLVFMYNKNLKKINYLNKHIKIKMQESHRLRVVKLIDTIIYIVLLKPKDIHKISFTFTQVQLVDILKKTEQVRVS